MDTIAKEIKKRLYLAIISCALVAIPFLAVKFPPITDLPQHVSQVRIFWEAISHSDSPCRIQWMTPYSLVYAILGLCWIIFGPLNAGRFGMLIIALFLTAMIHLLAAKQKRSDTAAVLASILFFCHILYWGFYQFALGWPVFLAWTMLLQHKASSKWREFMIFLLAAFVLYTTHILWFLTAIGWLVASTVLFRKNTDRIFIRLAGVFPLILLMALWYPSLSAYGFKSETLWATTPLERLSFQWLVDASFGGLKGSLEYVIFFGLAAWIGLACWQNRKGLISKIDKEFLLLAAFFLLAALFLPDKQVNTIRFAQRWVPPAFSFLLLAAPPVQLKENLRTAIAGVFIASFILVTSLSWRAFQEYELSGLRESLDVLPSSPRLLGLSFIKDSTLIKGSPYIQIFAYGQVLRGGELNFSFADFGPSLVVYRQKRRLPWTSALEWFPEWVKKNDFQFFDFVLVNADEKLHAVFSSDPMLKTVTQKGFWRLYQVISSTPSTGINAPERKVAYLKAFFFSSRII